MTRAQLESDPSITDALNRTLRLFRNHPELGTGMVPLALLLVDRAWATIPSHRIPPPDAPTAVTDALIETSLRAAIATVPAALAPLGDLQIGPEPLVRLRRTVAGWARDGITLGAVLTMLDRGYDVVFTALAEHAPDPARMTAAMKLLLDVRAAVSTGVIGVFATTDTGVVTASSLQTFTSALLAGHTGIDRAPEVGLPVFDRYQVVSLSVDPREIDGARGAGISPRTRLTSAVRQVIGDHAMALLSDAGGTIVAPVTSTDDLVSAEHLAALTLLIDADITATRVVGPGEAIPELAIRAEELLDLARAIGKPAGIYAMDDLMLEYQLTRPGPAHERLADLIRPLEGNAELLETLRVHMSCGMNRRETARRLSVHPNTVDNRMSRVSATIGLDLTRPQSIAQTQSAILAFDTVGRRAHRNALPSPA